MSDREKPQPDDESGEPFALVANADDRKQVKRARALERKQATDVRRSIAAVLQTRDGRVFLRHLLAYCAAYQSIYDDNPVRMAHRSGRQDVGHFVMAACAEADLTHYLLMDKERIQETAR